MKIALLGTGFGQARAAIYAQRPDVDQVIVFGRTPEKVFGRTPEKLATISDQYGFAATTDLDGLITDPSVDLVDICLPTRLHAEVAAPHGAIRFAATGHPVPKILRHCHRA